MSATPTRIIVTIGSYDYLLPKNTAAIDALNVLTGIERIDDHYYNSENGGHRKEWVTCNNSVEIAVRTVIEADIRNKRTPDFVDGGAK